MDQFAQYWNSLDYCLWLEMAKREYHGNRIYPPLSYDKQDNLYFQPCKDRKWPQQLQTSEMKYFLN